jgi:hypothetical protein
MRIGAVARQPKMAEGASLFRPTLALSEIGFARLISQTTNAGIIVIE